MPTLAENKRARFDYEILEVFRAGIELTGHEVKSLKKRGGLLVGAHVIIRGGETYLVGLDVHSFQPGNAPHSFDSTRTKRLLLNKGEINHLFGKTREGLTIIPLKLYDNARGKIKLDIALARGRKKYDKRELLKKREARREIRKGV
ncbi:MAG: SsrA-binding protein SmpB [Patescibacteria group bacterium]